MQKICKWQECQKTTVGKSSYCAEHRKAAREAWKARIAEQALEREEKYSTFEQVWRAAVEAGEKAMQECKPTPMVVQQHASPLDDDSPVIKQWHVPQGACGFAWVKISPGNCSFACWLKNQGRASKAYGGGVSIWISAGGQSIELKQAYAHAMVKVFNEHREALKMPASGAIYAQSRLD
jgi:hypothetical protein